MWLEVTIDLRSSGFIHYLNYKVIYLVRKKYLLSLDFHTRILSQNIVLEKYKMKSYENILLVG